MEKYNESDLLKKIKSSVYDGDYTTALTLSQDLDLNRIKNISALCLLGEIFIHEKQYDKAEKLLLRAYDKTPKGRRILDLLTSLYIEKGSYSEAEYYYKEFISVASRDLHRYSLRYRLDRGKGERTAVLIHTLEQLKDYEYIEEWAYELARLYHESGDDKKCVRECDDIALWFGHGEYVIKAMKLKEEITGEKQYIEPENEDEDALDPSATKIWNANELAEQINTSEDSEIQETPVENTSSKAEAKEETAAEAEEETEAAEAEEEPEAAKAEEEPEAAEAEEEPEAAEAEKEPEAAEVEEETEAAEEEPEAAEAEEESEAAEAEEESETAKAEEEPEAAEVEEELETAKAEEEPKAAEVEEEPEAEETKAEEDTADDEEPFADPFEEDEAFDTEMDSDDADADVHIEEADENEEKSEPMLNIEDAVERRSIAAMFRKMTKSDMTEIKIDHKEDQAERLARAFENAPLPEEKTVEHEDETEVDQDTFDTLEDDFITLEEDLEPEEETEFSDAEEDAEEEYDNALEQRSIIEDMAAILSGEDEEGTSDESDNSEETSGAGKEEIKVQETESDEEFINRMKAHLAQKSTSIEPTGRDDFGNILHKVTTEKMAESERNRSILESEPDMTDDEQDEVVDEFSDNLFSFFDEPKPIETVDAIEETAKVEEIAETEEAEEVAEAEETEEAAEAEEAEEEEEAAEVAEVAEAEEPEEVAKAEEAAEAAGEPEEAAEAAEAEEAEEAEAEEVAEVAEVAKAEEAAEAEEAEEEEEAAEVAEVAEAEEAEEVAEAEEAAEAAGEPEEAAEEAEEAEESVEAVEADETEDDIEYETSDFVIEDDLFGEIAAEAKDTDTADEAEADDDDDDDIEYETSDFVIEDDLFGEIAAETKDTDIADEVEADDDDEDDIEYETSDFVIEDDLFDEAEKAAEKTQKPAEVETEQEAAKEIPEAVLDIFSTAADLSDVKKQLAATFTKFESSVLEKQDLLASYEINFVVSGKDESMKSQIAVGIAKALNTYGMCDKDKIVRATAEELNNMDFSPVFAKIDGGCLIIVKAGRLSDASIKTLSDYIEQEGQTVAIILEDAEDNMLALWQRYPKLRGRFLNVINIAKYDEMELVRLAQSYAKKRGYDISEEARMVTLRDIFADRMAHDQDVNYEDIIAIIDEAVVNLEKRNMKNLFMTVLDNAYKEASMFTLLPEDFE